MGHALSIFHNVDGETSMSKRTGTSKERRRTIRLLNKKIEALSLATQAHVAVLTKLRDTTPHAVVKETINEVL